MPTPPFIRVCDEILEEGLAELSMSEGTYLAIVSHIEDGEYQIVSIRSPDPIFTPGDTFPLDDTLCRDVFTKGITIALTHVAREPGQTLHPLYHDLDIEAFISAPIYKRGEIWGTLNFTNLKIKRDAFSQREVAYTESAARRLSDALSSG